MPTNYTPTADADAAIPLIDGTDVITAARLNAAASGVADRLAGLRMESRLLLGMPEGNASRIALDAGTTGFVWLGQRAISNRAIDKVEGIIAGTSLNADSNLRTLHSSDTPTKVGRCGRACTGRHDVTTAKLILDTGTTSRSFASSWNVADADSPSNVFGHRAGDGYKLGHLKASGGVRHWVPDAAVQGTSSAIYTPGSSYDSVDVVGATEFDGATFGIAHMKDVSAGGDGSDMELSVYDGSGSAIVSGVSFAVSGSGLRRRAPSTSAHVFTAAWSQGWAIAYGGSPGGIVVAYKDETPQVISYSNPIGMWVWDGIVYVRLLDGRVVTIDTQRHDTDDPICAYSITILPAPIAAPILAAQTTEGDSPTGGPRLIDMHVHNGALVSVLTDGTDRYILAQQLPPEGLFGWR